MFTITTCKRFNLFTKTINSFINSCQDYLRLDKWICIDDNSSEKDRENMKQLYPFFKFIFKGPKHKGHVKSMNMILDEISEYNYVIHMEDDWHFFERRKYIKHSLDIFSENDKFGQVLFNRNYAERIRCRAIKGSKPSLTQNNLRYLIHKHYEKDTEKYKEYHEENKINRSNVYWPHYSLRPSMLKIKVLKEIGKYRNNNGHFEMDYAKRYISLGYKSAFFDTICCFHIGKCTWEKGNNAYTLNNVDQFSNKIIEVDTKIKQDGEWIIIPNLDSSGNDIKKIRGKVKDMKKYGINDEKCIGFNTLGFMKNKIYSTNEWIDITVPYPNTKLYIHKKRYIENLIKEGKNLKDEFDYLSEKGYTFKIK